jgi:hypothetical protein
MSKQGKLEEALTGVDAKKRATMMRLLASTVFATPIMATYALDALAISKAQARPANGSGKLI